VIELLTEICSYLGANGGGTVGTNLLAQSLPSTPNVCTAVFLNGGLDGPDSPVRSRNVEIVHRNTNVQSASSFMTGIHSLLRDNWNFSSTFQGRFVADSEPGFFGYDSNNMPVFSLELTFTSVK
jgi:hypothetical protein